MAEWSTPKTDWVTNPKNPVAEDFNRIEGNIDFLKQDIETKKGLIVDAINDMNQLAQVTDTHAQLASKIRDISKDATAAVGDVEKGKTFYAGGQKRTGTLKLTGNATAADVLSGKTFYNTNLKSKVTGTMPNRGAGGTVIPGTANIVKPAGYYSSDIIILGDPDLVAANIVAGKNIFGKAGSAPLAVTGSMWQAGYNPSGVSISFNAASVTIMADDANAEATAVTQQLIDVTNFSFIAVTFYVSKYMLSYIGLTSSKTARIDNWAYKFYDDGASDFRNIYCTWNISDITGTYYLAVGARGRNVRAQNIVLYP